MMYIRGMRALALLWLALTSASAQEASSPTASSASVGLSSAVVSGDVSALRDLDAAVRLAAARRLRAAPDPDDEEALAAALAVEESPQVRIELLGALNAGLRRGPRGFGAAVEL